MRRRSPTALVLFAVLALHASIASADTALMRADLTPAGDPLPPNLGNVGAFVSADGQWIGAHGFLRSLATGALVQWALDTDGTPVDGYAPGGARIISDDARYVAFIAGSYYNHPRFLRRERILGTTIELPIGIGGPVNGTVFGLTLSGNGNVVAFHSDGDNVAAGVPGGIFQVYAHDVAAGTTELISATPDGSPGNNTSSWPAVSADGRFVAFDCFASNLVPGLTEAAQVCVRERATGTTSVASVDSAGNPSTGSYGSGPLSADGRYMSFASAASNLWRAMAAGGRTSSCTTR